MDQPELVGQWQADVTGQNGPITLVLGPHPEWDGTVKGEIRRPGGTAIVVGDVNQGKLSMEESADGKSVSGNWFGDVVEGSCGRRVEGEWLDAQDVSHAFVLHKR